MGEAASASVNPLTQLGSGITGSLIIGLFSGTVLGNEARKESDKSRGFISFDTKVRFIKKIDGGPEAMGPIIPVFVV
jgi:hypothetical protein